MKRSGQNLRVSTVMQKRLFIWNGKNCFVCTIIIFLRIKNRLLRFVMFFVFVALPDYGILMLPNCDVVKLFRIRNNLTYSK